MVQCQNYVLCFHVFSPHLHSRSTSLIDPVKEEEEDDDFAELDILERRRNVSLAPVASGFAPGGGRSRGGGGVRGGAAGVAAAAAGAVAARLRGLVDNK